MKAIALILFILGLASCYGYYEDQNEDSWNLGTPDNIPKTEVIIMGDNCGCD